MMYNRSHFNIAAFGQEVASIVDQIPRGKVLTYGEIARLAGWPNYARQVGAVMRRMDDQLHPCHRVVSASGRLAPHYAGQATLLQSEGVVVNPNGCVDLSQYRFCPQCDF